MTERECRTTIYGGLPHKRSDGTEESQQQWLTSPLGQEIVSRLVQSAEIVEEDDRGRATRVSLLNSEGGEYIVRIQRGKAEGEHGRMPVFDCTCEPVDGLDDPECPAQVCPHILAALHTMVAGKGHMDFFAEPREGPIDGKPFLVRCGNTEMWGLYWCYKRRRPR